MKHRSKQLGLVLFAYLFLLISSAPTPATAQAKPLTKIRLATSTAGLDFAPIWIAQRKGYFKEEGIDFEHILTTRGAVTMAAVMNGDVQFAGQFRVRLLRLDYLGQSLHLPLQVPVRSHPLNHPSQ